MNTNRAPENEGAALERSHAEALLDEALAETFPAGDPVSVFILARVLRRHAAAPTGAAKAGDEPAATKQRDGT